MLVAMPTTLILGMIGFLWNSMNRSFDAVEKRFDRLETKIDTLFQKFADVDKGVAVLEKR